MTTYDDQFNEARDLFEEGRREEAIAAYKQMLARANLTPEQRMMIHYNLGFVVSGGLLQSPNVETLLTRKEIDECATNFCFARHLYKHFVQSRDQEGLRDANDAARGWANLCMLKLGATVRNFSGRWRTATSLVEDFRRFDGYPPEYFEEVAAPTTSKQSDGKDAKSGGCFIATAAFGSDSAPEVVRLRQFRDQVLSRSAGGRLFIEAYYYVSPPLAGWLTRHPQAAGYVRSMLASLVQVDSKGSRS